MRSPAFLLCLHRKPNRSRPLKYFRPPFDISHCCPAVYPNGRSPAVHPRKIGTPGPSAADLRNHTASSFPRMKKYPEILRLNQQLSKSSLDILSVESIHISYIPENTSHQMRLSGLQKEALALYRRCLRESRKKPAVCVPRPAHVSSIH